MSDTAIYTGRMRFAPVRKKPAYLGNRSAGCLGVHPSSLALPDVASVQPSPREFYPDATPPGNPPAIVSHFVPDLLFFRVKGSAAITTVLTPAI